MKYYVLNGNKKFVISATDPMKAAIAAFETWIDDPVFVGDVYTRVSEVGFDPDSEGHEEDVILLSDFIESHLEELEDMD